MGSEKRLFFIALVPPAPLLEELRQVKQLLAEKYSARAALRSPPHITLHMPFQFREDRVARLESELETVCRQHRGFDVSIEGYGAFPPRVIFLKVVPGSGLNDLQSGVQQRMKTAFNLFNARYRDRPFHPHLTLLFRDLKKADFRQAWDDLAEEQFARTWKAEEVCLLRHSGTAWQVYRQFPLKGA